MQLEPNLDNPSPDGEAPQPEEGPRTSNRTFILLAIPLVLVFLCIAGVLAWYALIKAPADRRARETQVANIVMQNATQIAIQTEGARQPPTPTLAPTLALPTETPVPPTATTQPTKAAEAGSVASPTPLLAVTASNTPLTAATSTAAATAAGGAVSSPTPLRSATTTSRTATPAKSATPLVGGLKTATPTQLPGTGFADEAGVPMLIVIALGLVVVAVVVRRLRVSLR